MKRKLEELQDTLGAFVEQRDHFVLVVGSTEAEAAWALKTLKGLDEESPSDLFLLFSQDAGPPAAYVTALLANLEAQLEGANTLKAEQGQAPWPPLPPLCLDA
ncbi:hypothetical protein HPP05_37090, partial [Corallococcus exiguus]|uniref:hypothetical protein n=1 Tax=Corallococcus exiguus TaxID=83462 RepID=UPI001C130693